MILMNRFYTNIYMCVIYLSNEMVNKLLSNYSYIIAEGYNILPTKKKTMYSAFKSK